MKSDPGCFLVALSATDVLVRDKTWTTLSEDPPRLSQPAARVCRAMPRWKEGKKEGRPAAVLQVCAAWLRSRGLSASRRGQEGTGQPMRWCAPTLSSPWLPKVCRPRLRDSPWFDLPWLEPWLGNSSPRCFPMHASRGCIASGPEVTVLTEACSL